MKAVELATMFLPAKIIKNMNVKPCPIGNGISSNRFCKKYTIHWIA